MRLFDVFVVEKEKILGQGEDSYLIHFKNKSNGIIGVYDGCGGMGSKKYEYAKGKTGAFIGSRTAALLTEKFYNENRFVFSEKDPFELQNRLALSMIKLKDSITENSGVKIKSSLFKELPTTASIIVMKTTEQNKLICEYIWAGDSRGYFIDEKGLCQMTRDDVFTEEDAFTSLRNDAKLKNVVYADNNFTLNSKFITFDEPVIVLSATDGAFGYLLTPMHFEFLILDNIYSSSSISEWKSNISKVISSVTGDDYSLTIALFGFENFESVKLYYKKRYETLKNNYIVHCNNADENVLKKLWMMYRFNYYRRVRL